MGFIILYFLDELIGSQDSSVVQRWATGWMSPGKGWELSKPALGSAQLPIQLVPGALSLGIKRSGREADYPPQSSAEIEMSGAISPFPNMPSWRGAQLKHRDNLVS